MKKLLLIIIMLATVGVAVSKAQITILKPILNNPSPILSEWQSRSSTAMVQVNNTSTTSRSCILWTEFFLNGDKVAYTQPSKLKPVTVRPGVNMFNGEDIAPMGAVHFENSVDISSQRAGRVPDGLICIIVHVMDPKTGAELAVSPNECSQIMSYFPPQLQLPSDGAQLCKAGNNNVIYTRDGAPMPNFIWSPIAPAPTLPVIYHFAIFEIYPNQQPISAILGNRALVEQDLVSQTSFLWPIQYFFPEPGKRYVWSVRALDGTGNPFITSNQGWSAPFIFSVSSDCSATNWGNTSGDSINVKTDSTAGGKGTGGGTGGSSGAGDTQDGSSGAGNQATSGTGNSNGVMTGSSFGDGSVVPNPNQTGDVTGGMNSMAKDARSYVAGRFGLEIDGVITGWVGNADGGNITSDALNEKAGADHIQKKHIAGVKYEDITVNCGTGMSKAFYEWIKSSFDRKYTRKDGAIVSADYNYKEYSRLDFFHALISEVGFPALDASSKDAAKMTIKFSPEWTRYKKGDSTRDLSDNYKSSGKVQKRWSPANFRLKIDGLDDACKRVNKIEAIVVKQKNTENPAGEMRDYQKEPAKLEIPNLVFNIPESDAKPLYDWLSASVINGKTSGSGKNASLTYYDETGSPVCTLTFINLSIVKIAPEQNSSSHRVKQAMARAEAEAESISVEF